MQETAHVQEVVMLLEDECVAVREAAVKALGVWRQDATADAVGARLGDNAKWVRGLASNHALN